MSDTKQAWEQVGHELQSLGLKLKLHLEQGADAEREAAQDAVHSLVGALDQTFTSLGNAVRDDAVHEDLGKVAASLRDALAATLEDAGTTLRNTGGGSDAP